MTEGKTLPFKKPQPDSPEAKIASIINRINTLLAEIAALRQKQADGLYPQNTD